MRSSKDELNLKRSAAILFVTLSLFVSAISACICDHHSVQTASGGHDQAQTHGHSRSAKAESNHSHHESGGQNSADETAEKKGFSAAAPQEECACPVVSPKTFGAFGNVKAEKQAVVVLPIKRVEIGLTVQTAAIRISDFTKPFYLSDSFYNISPGRAPPRL
ncbi:MAG: hypothetical protein JWN60_1393 [Acidobacteria bacterium]|jgi:hypothetical protein|nr:hypothetical protein [Acidobacteriota bacterium]